MTKKQDQGSSPMNVMNRARLTRLLQRESGERLRIAVDLADFDQASQTAATIQDRIWADVEAVHN